MWPFQRKQAAQFTRCKQRFLRQSCLKAQFLPPPPGECGGGDGGGGGGRSADTFTNSSARRRATSAFRLAKF